MKNYQGIYINLEKSKDRDEYIRSHLSKIHMLEHFKRFNAIDGTHINVPSDSNINSYEMACYDSHLQAMRKGEGKHIHIIEDDVNISQNFKFILKQLLDFQENKEQTWDIIFFGINVPIIRGVYDILLVNKFKKNKFSLFDLQDLKGNYAGFYSYIINRRSTEKIINLLEEQKYNFAIDVKIRNYVRESKIKAFLTLPLLSMHQYNLFDSTLPQRRVVRRSKLLPGKHFYLAQKLFFADSCYSYKELYKELMQYLEDEHHLSTNQPIKEPNFEEVAEYFLQSTYPYFKD